MNPKIFNIARCSMHDGNGIRTVVFMKGCNLRCKWCHNPESFSLKSEILFQKKNCIKCGRCIEICPEHHVITGEEVEYVREGCTLCLKCVDACPVEALAVSGKEMSPDEVFAEVVKDIHYYKSSRGGVTFSGGECLLFPEYLLQLLEMCKNAGINTAVETAFNVCWDSVEAVRNYVDMFIIDIKHSDNTIHKHLTGSGNQLILNNIERISNIHSSILIRIPLIPGANDDDANLISTAKLINSYGNGIKTIELLKYNNLAESKYSSLDKEVNLFADSPQEDKTMEQKCQLIREYVSNEIEVIF